MQITGQNENFSRQIRIDEKSTFDIQGNGSLDTNRTDIDKNKNVAYWTSFQKKKRNQKGKFWNNILNPTCRAVDMNWNSLSSLLWTCFWLHGGT